MPAFKSYVICTSPRSGSTLLCRLLQDAGIAGCPDSHFHAPSVDAWCGYYGLSAERFDSRHALLDAIVNAAQARGKGRSDVFGLRMQRQSIGFFLQQLGLLYPSLTNDKSRIEAAFGRTLFIYLTREDKLDQAISYVKAKQSGLWHMAADGTELERLSDPRDPTYDARAIASQLALAEQMEREWEDWFKVEQIEPLRVTYDALSAAPSATRDLVLRALWLDMRTLKDGPPPTAKLADVTSRDWADRFRRDHSG
ncbi:Stf0 sulfotransferase family protein [Jannaschia sp. CCS1]|uniref:Stf0 sulfotransferase family protein n=1 Tax=Jannaschia sp. (strain CCS1) TaxID=290400 RepID=UPI000053AA8E|nr:Stf0 sulfotransferase family protein [Jannaschia sp. CCS1]ABD55704.1 hypothetical protein Jann_2787 [Jannaschia sp. CCS1]